MKKLLVGFCLIAILVLAGCASSPSKSDFVFDPSIPEDQTSSLWVPRYVKVIQFNGQAVNWETMSWPVKVAVPVGEYTFVIDNVDRKIDNVPNVKNKSYIKKFEAGKGYQLVNENGQIVLIDRIE